MDHADVVKSLHKSLRKKYKEGQTSAEQIWSDLLSDKGTLTDYAKSMHNLATKNWDGNSANNRIRWCLKVVENYFEGSGMEKSVKKEEKTKLFEILRNKGQESEENKQKVQKQIENLEVQWSPKLGKKLLLDVGSCFNPFKSLSSFYTVGIDISPATDDVFYCDFINANIIDIDAWNKTHKESLSYSSFCQSIKSGELLAETVDVVVFSLLLSYFPSSEQRLKCVKNAHRLLQLHGMLLIITPDSSHQNRHAVMMKSWRHALEYLGFTRFIYEKLDHLHCMSYRKSKQYSPDSTEELKNSFYIPQDSQELEENQEKYSHSSIRYDESVFGEMEL